VLPYKLRNNFVCMTQSCGMKQVRKNSSFTKVLFKFRNYDIEAYAIFRGGEIIPILKEMHSMH
jgi:hypothetical protein